MKILITGAGALLGQGVFESLQRSNRRPDLILGLADPSPTAAALYWGDLSHIIPLACSSEYIDSLIALVKYENYQLIIPGTDVELPILSANKSLIESLTGCLVLVSNQQVIDIANDKYKTFQFLQIHGLNPPQSWLPENFDFNSESIRFPLIVKPRDGARSIGLYQVNTLVELKECLSRSKRPVIQECIGSPDEEYTAGSLTLDGKCIGAIILRRELKDGNTNKAFLEANTFLENHIVNVSNMLRPLGPCNFQFRLDEAGMPRIFEINARFSGTTIMRSIAGYCEVEWVVEYFESGILPTIPEKFRDLIFMRHWSTTAIDKSQLIYS